MKVSLVVEQTWRTEGERFVLMQGGFPITEVRLHDGYWLSPRPATTLELQGDRYEDAESACVAESDRAASRVLDMLSSEAQAVLREAGLLP